MANERLTDQIELTDKPSNNDVIHIVDVSNLTDNAAGSSRKIQVQNLLKGRAFQNILGCLVFKVNSSPTLTTIQATDWVIYMSSQTNRLVIGLATGTVSSVPADLDDSTKFLKFYDGSSLLP